MKEFVQLTRLRLAAVALGLILGPASGVRANVSVSDIKLNNSSTQATTTLGNSVLINYILSDAADLGATVNVYSNGTPIRVIMIGPSALATNGAGLSRGTNLVIWDGQDANSNSVGEGEYSVSVTASASGHASWTLLTANAINTHISSGGYYTFAPRGIAVESDTNSPYYGRVFVANAASGPSLAEAGNNDAILKFDADGSAAEDGAFGTGGYAMQDANFAVPQKLRTGDDNRLYMNDYYQGQIVAFDEALNGYQTALVVLNYFSNPFFNTLGNGEGWFAFDVRASETTNGPTGDIWMADYGASGSGAWLWAMTNGAANPTNETGTWAVYAGAGGSLTIDATGGFMVDGNQNVFASQLIDAAGDTNNRCMMFTNASGAAPVTNAFWAVGAGDDTFRDIFDTTINSRQSPQLVACAMAGPNASGIRLLNAADGSTAVANLDPTNTYYATAWDNVGNLYGASGSLQAWRVWSPPGGPNTSTTAGHAMLKMVSLFTLLGVAVTNNQVVISFTAAGTNAPSNFSLLSSPTVNGVFTTNAGAVFTNGSLPGVFVARAATNGPTRFYLIKQ